MNLLKQLIEMHNDVHDADEDDGPDNSEMYAREKQVSLLILRAFRKCGLPVAESDKSWAAREHDDYTGYDVSYSEDDGEANVELEEAELDQLAKLHESGLIEGKCTVVATRDHGLRLTFKVAHNLRDGKAKIE